MRTFQCTNCDSLIFFESQTCVHCGSPLGFDPLSLHLLAVQAAQAPSPPPSSPTPDAAFASNLPTAEAALAADPPSPNLAADTSFQRAPGVWRLKRPNPAPASADEPPRSFKFCKNALDHQSCNFLLDASDPHAYCLSCRQTQTIPNLATPGNLHAWTTIENAKRRLFYTLSQLRLEDAEPAPRYAFLEDMEGQAPVMTGHANGLITLNIAEADDAERTRRRIDLHEPYRTLLGHLRHEVGHFYWDRFFEHDESALAEFRALFGDERSDYAQALEHHYQHPKIDWQLEHVSQYASCHPWEDWAETWAHYLHLVDLQETAATYHLQFATHGTHGAIATAVEDPFTVFAQAPQDGSAQDIGRVLNQTMAVSLLLNSLNRSLGHNDAYPFALSSQVLEKLAFVHNAVRRFVHRTALADAAQAPS